MKTRIINWTLIALLCIYAAFAGSMMAEKAAWADGEPIPAEEACEPVIA